MKVKSVEYSRVFSLPNYENKKVGVVVELEENDVDQTLQWAIDFVEGQNPKEQKRKEDKEKSKKIAEFERMVSMPEDYTEEQVIEAIKFIRNERYKDLPS